MLRVVLLLVDGIRPDIFGRLLRDGELPSIARLFGGRRDPIDTLSSVFPSTTGPAHLPFLTGWYPGRCNLPGIRWFDPSRYAASPLSLRRFRSYIGPGALFLTGDLSSSVHTIFETVADHASAGAFVRRGLKRSRNLTRWAKLAEPVISFFAEEWDRLDRQVGLAVAARVQSGTRFVFGAFYSADSHAHKWGPFHDRTLESYRRIDAAIAPVADAVGRSPDWIRPLVLLVSDHGQSATAAHLDLHRLVERAVGCSLAHPAIWHGWIGAAAAVMVSGNAMAHIYLRGDRWGMPQFVDSPSAEMSRLVDALLAEDAIDQVIGRRSAGGAVVLSQRGRARVERSAVGVTYVKTSADDPFGYSASIEGTHDDDRWLDLTWDTEYPDAPVQILQILQSPRAGHLIVTARRGYDLRARFEKPRHVGSHGSLHRDHMMTPVLSTGPLDRGPHRTVDIYPTILDALGYPLPAGLDGRSLLRREVPSIST